MNQKAREILKDLFHEFPGLDPRSDDYDTDVNGCDLVDFFSDRAGGIRDILDEADPYQPLRDACRGVLATWEEGNLAAAVNRMERELDCLEGVTPRTEAPATADGIEHEIEELINLYGYHGEHPEHDLDSWQEEVINENTRLGYCEWVIHRIVELLEPMDSDRRYLMLYALYNVHQEATQAAREAEAAHWRQAAAEKRIRTQKIRNLATVKVWIETKKEN